MKNPPCIRGLKVFNKGCPQKTWDGTEGCPAWIEEMVIKKDDPLKRIIEKKCIDLWMFTIAWHSNGLLEGNQRATEKFRNAMVELDEETGKDVPKMDRGVVALLNFFHNFNRTKQLM